MVLLTQAKRLPVALWCSKTGREPVRESLKGLDKDERILMGDAIMTVEFGWPVGMPVCRAMGQGLFEVRVDFPRHGIARVLFCVHRNRMVLLHGFIKKEQKTRKPDLDLAKRRKQQLENPR